MLLCLHKTIIQLLSQYILAPRLKRSRASFIKPILKSDLILKSMDLILCRNKLGFAKAKIVTAVFLYVNQVKIIFADKVVWRLLSVKLNKLIYKWQKNIGQSTWIWTETWKNFIISFSMFCNDHAFTFRMVLCMFHNEAQELYTLTQK